jgi:Flp pilus assembly protein TadG
MMLQRKKARPGTILAETALVYPVLFLLVLAIILLGLAVFRYQQVSHISREASRWASVHGEQYAKENNTTAATPQDVYDKAILPFAAGMQLQGITYSVTWNAKADGTPDKRPTRVVTVIDPANGLDKDVAQYNTVTVTVTYTWNTGLFGTIPVSSTSVNTIFY